MNKVRILLLCSAICVLLCGCNFWLEDSYVSVKPYHVQNANKENEVISADSYMGIREALEAIVEDCVQSAVIAVPKLDEKTVDYYMVAATNYVKNSSAIGAYAVDQISYEIGTNAGERAISVNITYNFNRIEILRLGRVADTDAVVKEVEAALQQYDSDVTLYVYNYSDADFVQIVQDYVDKNPHLCMELPQVAAAVYPETGKERVVVLSFTYRNSREVLRSMQSNVQEVFSQVKAEGETVHDKYASLYAFLMDKHEYTVETSLTPSYSLLRYGVGDSKAFATIFAAMCAMEELDCSVVSGTRNGEAWYWNIIAEGKNVYFVDLLRCKEEGAFRMMEEEQMSGYVWDYSAFPAPSEES